MSALVVLAILFVCMLAIGAGLVIHGSGSADKYTGISRSKDNGRH
jgi:hypothetical protein